MQYSRHNSTHQAELKQQQPPLRTNETYDELMKIYEKQRFVSTNELRDRLRGQNRSLLTSVQLSFAFSSDLSFRLNMLTDDKSRQRSEINFVRRTSL